MKAKKTEAEIDEVLWQELAPLLPPTKARRFRHPGRKPHDPRAALGGVLFVLRSGIGWARLPWALGFGSGMRVVGGGGASGRRPACGSVCRPCS